MQNATITIKYQPKGILPQLSTSQVKCQFGQSSQLRMFQFKKLLLHMPSHERKKLVIIFLRLQSTTTNCKALPRWFLFPPSQPSSFLSTKSLIRPRKRVLSDSRDYLNPQNKSRYHYYPQKRKPKLRDVWGEKLTWGDAYRRKGFICWTKEFTGNSPGTFVMRQLQQKSSNWKFHRENNKWYLVKLGFLWNCVSHNI